MGIGIVAVPRSQWITCSSVRKRIVAGRSTRSLGSTEVVTRRKESFIIMVRAKPRSSVSALEQESPARWVARLRSSPVDGKANAELIALVAKHFGCARSCVTVVSGATARLKLVRVSGTAGGEANGAA